MSFTASTTVETVKASGYLPQLCKHFGHKTDTSYSTEAGWIEFDFGRADLEAAEGQLEMKASAETQEALARLKNVLASHLERFAFREELSINWAD